MKNTIIVIVVIVVLVVILAWKKKTPPYSNPIAKSTGSVPSVPGELVPTNNYPATPVLPALPYSPDAVKQVIIIQGKSQSIPIENTEAYVQTNTIYTS